MIYGTLLVISAPSGAGKSSLVKALLQADSGLALSISHTTRAARPGERDGVEYHFTERSGFEAMLAANTFLEYAEVFGNYYGTAQPALEALRQQGHDVILEIDQQGAAQVRQRLPDAVTIFILPPSREALYQRLTGRGQDAPEVIQRRIGEAAAEIAHCGEFDYIVINDQFDQALADLQAIIHAQRCRRERQLIAHAALIHSLKQE